MIEVSPQGRDPQMTTDIPPVLVLSGGQGTTDNLAEVHVSIRRGNHIEPLGWYDMRELVIATHVAGANRPTPPARYRITEPAA